MESVPPVNSAILTGWIVIETRSVIIVGGLFSTDIHVLNYVYGRISSFGYYPAFGLGVFGTYGRPIKAKSHVAATLQLLK